MKESVSPFPARNGGRGFFRFPRAMKKRRRRASGKKRSPAARGKEWGKERAHSLDIRPPRVLQ